MKLNVFMRLHKPKHFRVEKLKSVMYEGKNNLRMLENKYILKYDTIKNGMNHKMAYCTKINEFVEFLM